MMPDQVLSTTVQSALTYINGETTAYAALTDTEMGGVALRDASQGLRVKTWTVSLSGSNVMLGAPDVADTIQFTRSGITELSLAFDQNMNPFIAFVESGVAKYWWFDTLTQLQTFTTLPASSTTPRCTMDDKRAMQVSTNDIILAYVVAGALKFRAQRDRYLIEYPLATGIVRGLQKIAMNTVNRLQFQFGPPL